MMKKRYVFLLVFVGLLMGSSYYILNHVLPYMIIKPYRLDVEKIYAEGGFQNGILPSDYGLTYKSIEWESVEKYKLKGYVIKSQQNFTAATFILLHGIGGCKEHMLGLAENLTSLGYRVVIYDSRAHGQSEGEYCTYGAKEVSDLKLLVNKLENSGFKEPFAIWGNSMGGAVALQALAQEKRLKLGIIESAFADLGDIIFDYKKRMLNGYGLRWISDYALKEACSIADFEFDTVVPANSAKKITQPVFMAHGDHDVHISIDYGKKNFVNLASEKKNFYKVVGGTHFNLWQAGGKDYTNQLFTFIEQNIGLLKADVSP